MYHLNKLLSFNKLLTEQYGKDKVPFYLYTIFRLAIIALIIYLLISQKYEHIWQCVLSLIMFLLPPFFERFTNTKLPPFFLSLVLIFICGANIFGEVFSFYVKFKFWDTMLHTAYGFVFGGFCFSLINVFNKEDQSFKLSTGYLCFSTVSSTLFFGLLWEYFEFFADQCLGKDMQKDHVVDHFQSVMLDDTKSNIPIKVEDIAGTIIKHSDGTLYELPFSGYLDIGAYDTMKDMLVATLGVLLFLGFLIPYLRSHGNNKVAKSMIPTRRNWREEPPVADSKLAASILKLISKLENKKEGEK